MLFLNAFAVQRLGCSDSIISCIVCRENHSGNHSLKFDWLLNSFNLQLAGLVLCGIQHLYCDGQIHRTTKLHV